MKRLCLAALVSLALTAPAHAARPTYSYLEAAYLSSENDSGTFEAQGPRVNLSISLARWVYFSGEVDRLDVGGSDSTLTASTAGFGVHSLKSNFQMFGVGTYERRDLSGTADATDEGYGVLLGVRVPLLPKLDVPVLSTLELQADYKYLNFGDLPNGERDDDDRYRAILQARVTRNMALTGTYEMYEQADLDQWAVGLRFYFKTQYDVPRKKKRSAPAATASTKQEAETQ
jgi:hypothetical protein